MKIKVILTICALVLASIVLYIKFNLPSTTEEGVIKIELVMNERVEEKEVLFNKGDKFIHLLYDNYDIEINSGGMIVKIDFIEAYDISVNYIAIYKNDEYSNYGVRDIKFKNNDKITFKYLYIGDANE